MKTKKTLASIFAAATLATVVLPTAALANPMNACGTCGRSAYKQKVSSSTQAWDCNGGYTHRVQRITWRCTRDGDLFDTEYVSCGWCRR